MGKVGRAARRPHSVVRGLWCVVCDMLSSDTTSGATGRPGPAGVRSVPWLPSGVARGAGVLPAMEEQKSYRFTLGTTPARSNEPSSALSPIPCLTPVAIDPFWGRRGLPRIGFENETRPGILSANAVETGQRQGRRGSEGTSARYDRTSVPPRGSAAPTGVRVGGLLHHGPRASAGKRCGRGRKYAPRASRPPFSSATGPEALAHPSTAPEELVPLPVPRSGRE